MREYPKPQEIYRHFKGNCYQIITLARNSETKERMVVYQQLYEPYEVYVRPLEMFMSRVDTNKYPNEKQKYRFERISVKGDEAVAVSVPMQERKPQLQEPERVTYEVKEPEYEEDTSGLNPLLIAFLDADSYERKLEILSALHPVVTDEMIDTMAVSLDTEVKDGDIEQRYVEIRNCLITMERFECNRLR